MSPMGAMPGQASMPQMPGLPQMPTPPPGFPSFDQNNPLAAMMALTAMGFPNMPGMPPFSPSQSPYQPNTRRPMPPKKPGQRCRDYETKGFCVRGVSCPYEHGNDHLVIPGPNATEEYDPANAVISNFANGASPTRTSNRGGLRNDRARGGRGVDRGGRAAFSMTGPNRDRSKTTIVVEQIPEEHFTEEAVRGVFGEFGNILEVDMQPYKRLATVKYDDYYSAKAAWESPKTIFDNRFVKVYWYKPEEQQTPSSAPVKATNGTSTGASKAADGADQKENDDEDIDMADFTAKQAEAQKVHEEKMKKLKEAEDQKEKLAKQQREQAEERRKLLEKLRLKEQAKASAGPGTEAGDGTTETNGTPVDKKKAATEALKAKLAELEAEAESMGLNPDEPPSDPWSSPFRGRGRRAYRGRGTYAPRGRGFDPYRGGYSYRGRGGNPYGGVGRGAVMRLDNRPKRVSVTLAGEGEEWNGDADEALKLYLMVSCMLCARSKW